MRIIGENGSDKSNENLKMKKEKKKPKRKADISRLHIANKHLKTSNPEFYKTMLDLIKGEDT